MKQNNPLNFQCPKCHARTGWACSTLDGKWRSKYHKERIELANSMMGKKVTPPMWIDVPSEWKPWMVKKIKIDSKKKKEIVNLDVLREYNDIALRLVIASIDQGYLTKATRANLYTAKTMLAIIDNHLSECGAKVPTPEGDKDA